MADQKLIKLKVNDREIQVPQGSLVIEATRRLGTEVPSFCYYPGLSLQAACRMCLVEVEKAPKLQTACTLVATDGMVVRTDTDQVRQARKYMLEFLLANHPLDCPVCDKGGECELQDMVFRYGADSSRFVEEKIHRPEEKWSELVYYDAPRLRRRHGRQSPWRGYARREQRDYPEPRRSPRLRRVWHVH